MSSDPTFIEPPQQPRYQPPPPEPPLPPMPPPPEPPGRGRNLVPLAIVMGVLIVVLCGIAAFGIWRLVQNGVIPLGDSATQTPDPLFLTQTAVIEVVTDIVLSSETPIPSASATIEPTSALPAETLLPTETATNTTVPTPSVPTFTASQAIFCRTGPSTIYKEWRTMDAGQTLPILGKSISPVDNISVWYLVEIEGAQCYVSSGFGTVAGDVSSVPTLPAPPTPTPTPSPTPTNTPTATATPP